MSDAGVVNDFFREEAPGVRFGFSGVDFREIRIDRFRTNFKI